MSTKIQYTRPRDDGLSGSGHFVQSLHQEMAYLPRFHELFLNNTANHCYWLTISARVCANQLHRLTAS